MSYASHIDSSSPKFKRFLPGLNAMAAAMLVARARQEDVWKHSLTVSRLAPLGMARDDCRDLIVRGLAMADGKLGASCRMILTDAGLAFLQSAVSAGAIRPIFDIASRRLVVAGETIVRLAVQSRNLSAFLTAIEAAGWPPRVANALNGRPSGDDHHHLAIAAHRLNIRQNMIDFHADDGAATWNWRPSDGPERRRKLKSDRD